MKKKLFFAILSIIIVACAVVVAIHLTSKVTVDFSFSHPEGITLHPGSDMVYEFTLKNNSIFPKTVKISDPSDELLGEPFEKEIKVGGRKSEKVTYTLKTADDLSLVGSVIERRTITVNDNKITVPEVFIERTFNEWDQRKIRLAILALESAPVENATMLKWIYYVAYSKAAGLTGEPSEILTRIFEPEKAVTEGDGHNASIDEVAPESVSTIQMVVPRLYFSQNIAKEVKPLLRGEPLDLNLANFVAGDIFVTDEKMYIYDGEKFWLLKKDGMVKTSTEEIKNGEYERWAVLRPSMVIENINYSTPYSKEGFSDKELAVVATAEAFLLRGMRYQYDDTRFCPSGSYRWQIRAIEPEDATLQHTCYSNCAAFALDCNQFGIGYKTESFAVSMIVNSDPLVYQYEPTGEETEEDKKKIEEEFMNTLRPGDIICIRRKNNSGHAMLYVGCGDIIHSSGGNYNYEKGTETYEPTVRFMRVLDLFREEAYPTSYVFTKLTKIAIARPALSEKTEITENAKARLENLEGLVVEKLSSHNKANTINIGDEITYTISIFNTNKEEKTVDIAFEVPENTTHISGTLNQSVTIPSEERVNVEFKFKVDGGDKISGGGTTVGGVRVTCPDVKVGKTLTLDEQEKVKALIDKIDSINGTELEKVNAIYEEVLGTVVTEETELNKIQKGFVMLSGDNLTLKKTGKYAKAIAPTLYGGRNLLSSAYDNARIRLLKKEHLIVGDLLFIGDNDELKLYIWSGEDLIDLNTNQKVEELNKFLEGILTVDQFFVVFRPSMIK